MTARAGRTIDLAADLTLRLGVWHSAHLSQFKWPVCVPGLATAAAVRTQNLAADAAIATHFRNQDERGLPVRIGARTQLDDISNVDRVAKSSPSGQPRAVEQSFEQMEFFGGEHAPIIPPLSGSVQAEICAIFISSEIEYLQSGERKMDNWTVFLSSVLAAKLDSRHPPNPLELAKEHKG